MYCYHCGCELSEFDYCTACGTDVGMYKRIMFAANRLYNEGLDKASVRDLSGAADSLRECLKFNKRHIEARNLLGLVYFEMGEVAAALTEWIISQNFRKEKNIAVEYISRLQSNVSRFEQIRSAIRGYNKAYSYCQQGSRDLAVIQLRSVVKENPNFLRAQQLLALLYISNEEWSAAERVLLKALEIDHNNTICLRYLREAERMLEPEESPRGRDRIRERKAVRYQSGNELIIQPGNIVEPKSSGFSALLNIIIGLIIGMAAIYYLAVPARIAGVTEEYQAQIKTLGEELDSKTAAVNDLESRIRALESENEQLGNTVNGYTSEDGTLNSIDSLLRAAKIYMESGDKEQVSACLETVASKVDITTMSQAFQDLYNALVGRVGGEMTSQYYAQGMEAYRQENYVTAIELLEKAVFYDDTNKDALFDLANAYRRSGDADNAIRYYNQICERFPDSEYANKSKQYLSEMATD